MWMAYQCPELYPEGTGKDHLRTKIETLMKMERLLKDKLSLSREAKIALLKANRLEISESRTGKVYVALYSNVAPELDQFIDVDEVCETIATHGGIRIVQPDPSTPSQADDDLGG